MMKRGNLFTIWLTFWFSMVVFQMVGCITIRQTWLSVVRKFVASSSTALLLVCPSPAPAALFGRSPTTIVRDGMGKFMKGDVDGSLKSFDEALKMAPTISPYLWQRGISMYYMEDYEGCKEQFRSDVAANPSDTEEVVWAVICDSAMGTKDFATAQRKMLTLADPDSRPIMRSVYKLFKGRSNMKQFSLDSNEIANGKYGEKSASTPFYADLYLGLYYEAMGKPEESLQFIDEAANSEYCDKSRDYMCSVAANHLRLRTEAARKAAEKAAAEAMKAAEKAATEARIAAEKAAAETEAGS